MQAMVRALRVQQPVLVAGPNGAGKSELLRVLAQLLGWPVQQLCLTAETAPADLLGQFAPSQDPGQRICWRDGQVTQCARRGEWALLDNLTEAEPCVAERLNPVMEQPPVVVLADFIGFSPGLSRILRGFYEGLYSKK